MPSTDTTVKSLFCPKCDAIYSIDSIMTLCSCGAPLLVDYDYYQASRLLSPEKLKARHGSMWKYRELLPVKDEANIVTLGEGGTPLLPAVGIGPEIGYPNLYFKDETVNPTGSFKARGLGMAVSRAKELGLKRLIIPTAGNAGSALAAYAARAEPVWNVW